MGAECDPNYPGALDGLDGLPESPEDLAAKLATHVAPERFEVLVMLVAETAAAATDPVRKAYWEAVYAALIK